mgnify:CR=1 FL=1
MKEKVNFTLLAKEVLSVLVGNEKDIIESPPPKNDGQKKEETWKKITDQSNERHGVTN